MKDQIIRVLVIDDDHHIIVAGLKNLFRASRDGIDFTASASSPETAVSNFDPAQFDLIFLDLYIPDSEPQGNIEQLKTCFPGKPIIMYTTEEAFVWKKRTSIAGARGYLTKKDDKATIKYVIKTVASGQTFFHGLTDEDERNKLTITFLEQNIPVTAIQKEILVQLSKGINRTEIAREFRLSISNLDKTLYHLRKKFVAKNNIHLIRILSESGII